MRVILPGGLRVDWSPNEVAEAMRILTQSLLDTAVSSEPTGLTLANPLIVRDGDTRAALTPMQHAVLRYVLSHGPSTHEDVIEAVWMGKPIAEKTLRTTCDAANVRMMDAGISWEISTRGSHVSIKKTDA